MPEAARSLCGGCGHVMKRAHRRFEGVLYCNSCYVRDFRLRACSQCHSTVSLPRSQETGLCDACKRQQRTCCACGKPTPIAGQLIADGALCPACARRQAPKPLQHPDHYATCSLCRKHRKISIRTEQGKPVCANCVAHGPEATLAKTARYWEEALDQRHIERRGRFEGWVQDLFDGFVGYQRSVAGTAKTQIRYDIQEEAFAAVMAHFGNPQEMTAEQLAGRLGAKLFRKSELVMRFLSSTGVEMPSPKQLADEAERRRIQMMLVESASLSMSHIVAGYIEYLSTGSTSLRSQRQAIRAAVNFAQSVNSLPPTQVQIDQFMRRTPGQRANLLGFLGFVRQRMPELNLKSPDKRRRRRTAKASAKNVFEATLVLFRTTSSSAERRACVAAMLSAMTGAPLQIITALPRRALNVTNQRITLSLMGKTIMLIDPVRGPVMSYLQELEALERPSQHLFPGRSAFNPMNPSSISDVLRRRGITPSILTSFARQKVKDVATRRFT